MKRTLLIITITFCSFKTAQVKTLNFAFTVNETQTILKALSKLPYEESSGLINKVQMAAQKQLADTTNRKQAK